MKTSRSQRNQQFLSDLFSGPFRGHALVVNPAPVANKLPDFSLSNQPVKNWVAEIVADYEARLDQLERYDDDSVPVATVHTHTGIFAAGFGCQIETFEGSNAAARPCVTTAAAADALVEPDIDTTPLLARWWELTARVHEALGPDVPVSVPDIQSPFDIAALIWNKEDLFTAMIEEPATVKRLVEKCQRHLKAFLRTFRERFPTGNLIHCPNAWAPQRLGCSLSEDEAGSLSVAMFEEFCLPSLIDLSETFGGMFMHCCAKADHQYPSFQKIPNLRGFNRVFQYPPGPGPAIAMFSGRTVLMQAWMNRDQFDELLDRAQPDTRYLLNLSYDPEQPDETRRLYDHLRERCPHHEAGTA